MSGAGHQPVRCNGISRVIVKAFSIRIELWIALIVTLFSLLLLPGLIFLVGSRLFGVYKSGLAGLYSANLQGLLKLQWAPWLLTLAPSACVWLVRAVLRLTAGTEIPDRRTRPSRKEPRLEP
jgi:hypothetical protein